MFEGIANWFSSNVVTPASNMTKSVAEKTGLAPATSSSGVSSTLGTAPEGVTPSTMTGGRKHKKYGKTKKVLKSKKSRKH